MNRLHTIPDTTFPQQSLASPVKVFSTSPFTSHRLQPASYQKHPVGHFQPDWITGILILLFILLAWAQVFYYKRIKQIIMAPLSKRFLNQLSRDGNLFKERVSVALGIVYVLSFSLLLFEINEIVVKWPFGNYRGLSLYFIITTIFIAFWVFKIIVIRLLGTIFRTKPTTHEYLLNMLIFCHLSGLILLPLLVMVIYMKSAVIVFCAVAILSLLFLFRFVRGFFIGISLSKFSYLFLIVYLCTLEILPLLILGKLLLNHIHSTAL